ncbi:MAG: hypothetical protein ACMXYG_05640 [Candidatus Woesearchaeota archaeon]
MYGEKKLLWAKKDCALIEYYGWSKKPELKLSEPHLVELLEKDIVKIMAAHLKHHENNRHYKPHPKEHKHGDNRILYFKIGSMFKRIEIGNFKIIIHDKKSWYDGRYHKLRIVFKIYFNSSHDEFISLNDFKVLWSSQIHSKFGGLF